MKKSILLATTMAFMPACAATVPTSHLSHQALAVEAKEAIFKSHNAADVNKYFKQDYIQHSTNLASGIDAVLDILPDLKATHIDYQTHRVFQDGNFVVMHNAYTNAHALGANEVVSFDIFRIEDGKVAEHWDAVTPKVAQTASGRSQIDGPTQVVDQHKTDENKQLVRDLIDKVFIGGQSQIITQYISTEQYDQHNPMVKDGLNGLVEAIQYLSSQNNMFKYYKVHKLLGEGNFVLAQVEGEWNQKPHVFYDLFRVENGKVVEHWDIVNEIPAELPHSNGIF